MNRNSLAASFHASSSDHFATVSDHFIFFKPLLKRLYSLEITQARKR